MSSDCYIVRFKGHVCAAVQTGLSRKPILLRKKKDEPAFVSELDFMPAPDFQSLDAIVADQNARLECARAIKRTNALRKKLSGDHMLRGQPHVERLLRDAYQTRRGKRWKICPADSKDLIQ